MRKGTFSVIAAGVFLAAPMLGAAPVVAQQTEAPHRVVPATALMGRVVHDDLGQPVGKVRDVVFSRATGESLAVLEVLGPDSAAPPSHVVAPLSALRLPADNVLRLLSGVQVAALPPIDVPPRSVSPLAGSRLMVPPPDAGPLRVITPVPQVAAEPPSSTSSPSR